MRIFCLFFLTLFIHGSALCQNEVAIVVTQLYDQINQSIKTEVGGSIFDGYIISNDNVSANYRSLVRENFQTAKNAVIVTQKSAIRNIQINLTPETAERIAKEAEPYVMLAQRKRRFSESIAINSDITIKLESDGDITMSIILMENNDTVIFHGASVADFVHGFSNATVDAKGWYVKEFLRLIMASSMNIND